MPSIVNNMVQGETFLLEQIFMSGGFALQANLLGHLEQIDSTSLKGPNNGIKSVHICPEHPRTFYVGAEADDWPTLRFYVH